MILITVSTDASFHRDTIDALEGYLPEHTSWQISYLDTNRLRAAATHDKHLVLIDFSDATRALHVAHAVDGRPEFAVIAVGGGATRDELLQLMQAGVRDVLTHPDPEEVRRAAHRALAKLTSAGEPGDIYAFVPAKPGCGSTTIATHAAAALSRITPEPALLLDFDIRMGMTSFLLKAEGNHTIVDALEQSDRLDEDIWSSLVSQCDNLHLIGSGPVDFSRPVPAERFGSVLRFAIQKYSSVVVDLPGTMDEYECETLRQAKGIFLVCTQDIGALHVARRKSSWLHSLGVADRVAVVLNRVERRSALGVADLEGVIQMPVRYLVTAGAAEIARAAQRGVPLEGSSALGKQIGKIAADIVGVRPRAKKLSPVRRFADYFSISMARDRRTS